MKVELYGEGRQMVRGWMLGWRISGGSGRPGEVGLWMRSWMTFVNLPFAGTRGRLGPVRHASKFVDLVSEFGWQLG